MFERDPNTAPKLTKEQQEARALLQQAEEAECRGAFPEAMKFYKRAYKLDPSLEHPR